MRPSRLLQTASKITLLTRTTLTERDVRPVAGRPGVQVGHDGIVVIMGIPGRTVRAVDMSQSWVFLVGRYGPSIYGCSSDIDDDAESSGLKGPGRKRDRIGLPGGPDTRNAETRGPEERDGVHRRSRRAARVGARGRAVVRGLRPGPRHTTIHD